MEKIQTQLTISSPHPFMPDKTACKLYMQWYYFTHIVNFYSCENRCILHRRVMMGFLGQELAFQIDDCLSIKEKEKKKFEKERRTILYIHSLTIHTHASFGKQYTSRLVYMHVC